MSLFPAYAQISGATELDHEVELSGDSLAEAQLLASDNDEEREASKSAAASYSRSLHELNDDFYIDRKLDVGNLRVSTLYYPGRPHYSTAPARRARASRRARRYFAAGAAGAPDPAAAADALADAELAQRTRAFRDMLAENPSDEALWLRFIEFQERTRDPDAALAAANEAAARLSGSGRVRAALHRARELALPPPRRLELLRQDLAAAPADGALLTELWLRVLACAADAGGADMDAVAAAALAATRAHALAYPHILYAYGAYLRAAGQWERLVLLLELVASMNFPPAAFPPHVDPEYEAEQERRLLDFEDKAVSSGLPLSTVWVRVERARAAAHWRAAPGAADPARWPLAADVAELLRAAAPPADELLLLQALRLAKVPLLPAAQHALAAAGAGAADAQWAGAAGEADGGEALLALLRAARRLPAAHPARPRARDAARLLALLTDPPHYFSDDAGYLSWVTALWDAACEWTTGDSRVALLCWRLRWLHSLLLVVDTQEEAGRAEARRMRGAARAALKRYGGASALPYAQLARLLHAAGDPAAARAAALHALRHAQPAHVRLYVARVVGEVCDEETIGEWAIACAALGQPLPSEELLLAPPPRELLQRALLQCEERCSQLEEELLQPAGAEPRALQALLPAPGEWAAARARLASPARRAVLVRLALAALAELAGPGAAGPGPAARYWEQVACALVTAGAREHRLVQYARAFAPYFPHNALIVLACSGAPLWAWQAGGAHEQRLRALPGAARSPRAALAHALPALLRAEPAAAAAAAAVRRAARAAPCALLAAARLEAEARAPQPHVAGALYAALDRLPQHKWLAVRGAAWLGAQAPALADVLLERQLRVHALLDELAPPPHGS